MMVVGSHPPTNPANWAGFSRQWLLRKDAKSTSLTGSLSEGAADLLQASGSNSNPHFTLEPPSAKTNPVPGVVVK